MDRKKKLSLKFIYIYMSVFTPIMYVFLSAIFLSGLITINLKPYIKIVWLGFILFSIYYIFMPLFIVKRYVPTIDEEKGQNLVVLSKIVIATYFSFLGLFLSVLLGNIWYAVIGAVISIIFGLKFVLNWK